MKKYEMKLVKVAISMIAPHGIYSLINKPTLDPYYINELKRFGGKHPVAVFNQQTEEYLYVCNKKTVLAAEQEGLLEIEIWLSECPLEEAIRLFGFFNSLRKDRDYATIYNLSKHIGEYFSTAAGKEWKQELGGDERTAFGRLFGYESAMMGRIKYIGDNGADLFERIGKKNGITMDGAAELIKTRKVEREQQQLDDIKEPSRKKEAAPKTPKSLLTDDNTSVSSAGPDFTSTLSEDENREFSSTSTPLPHFDKPVPVSIPFDKFGFTIGETEMVFHLKGEVVTKAVVNGSEVDLYSVKFIPGKTQSIFDLMEEGSSVCCITINNSLLKK